MDKNVIGVDGDIILRELMDSDLEKLAIYANNEKVSINLRDGFPKTYTIENARSLKKKWLILNVQRHFLQLNIRMIT